MYTYHHFSETKLAQSETENSLFICQLEQNSHSVKNKIHRKMTCLYFKTNTFQTKNLNQQHKKPGKKQQTKQNKTPRWLGLFCWFVAAWPGWRAAKTC